MAELLAGKVCLVTGGARGLGRAIVERLASEGAAGLVLDVLDPGAVPSPPAGWVQRRGSVAEEADLTRAMTEAASSTGSLDIVVANAGIVPPWRETEAIDLAEWRQTFAVNAEGVMATIKHAVPHMKAKGGAIIAMGSLNSRQGHAQQAAYVSSKHAVLGIVRAAALDLGRYGIRVNALAPGPIATEALVGRVADRARAGGTQPEAAFETMRAATALGRMAGADEVAAACVFLASDLSAGITGQVVPVDAGLP